MAVEADGVETPASNSKVRHQESGAATRPPPQTPTRLGVVKVNDTTRYEIHVPTNIELAPNLKGSLLLAHGDQDNNVTPSGTIRLMDALIKANKRFDFIMLPGQQHRVRTDAQNYFSNERLLEYFAEHLLGDYYRGTADMKDKRP